MTICAAYNAGVKTHLPGQFKKQRRYYIILISPTYTADTFSITTGSDIPKNSTFYYYSSSSIFNLQISIDTVHLTWQPTISTQLQIRQTQLPSHSPNMSSTPFLSPSHPLSFEDMLRQFHKLSSNLDSRSVNSHPPSPLLRLGAPFVPASCQLSSDLDLCIPPSHTFHNDPRWNLSPASSSSSDGPSLPSCFLDELPATRTLFEEFRYTRSRVLHVCTLLLYHVSTSDKFRLEAPEGSSLTIAVTRFVLNRGKRTLVYIVGAVAEHSLKRDRIDKSFSDRPCPCGSSTTALSRTMSGRYFSRTRM